MLELEGIPAGFEKDKCLETYFKACERAGFTKAEDEKYTKDMMNEWDIENAKELAVREGREEGREEGRKEGRQEGLAEGTSKVAKALLENGVDIKVISKCTGLSEEDIRAL